MCMCMLCGGGRRVCLFWARRAFCVPSRLAGMCVCVCVCACVYYMEKASDQEACKVQ